jgi:chemotaxis protein MotB
MMDFQKSRLLALVYTVALLSGCVSQGKYRALEETTSAEQTKLQGEITALQSQKDNLQKEKDGVESEIAALKDRQAQMEKQAAEISAQKDAEINRLKGTYEDLVKDLKGEIEQGEIKVTQIQNRLSVNLVEKVLFDSGQADVKAHGKDVLKKVGKILKGVQDKEIRIEGYTDDVPIGGALKQRFPTNWELSTQRATNVLRFLQDEAGVDGTHLSAVGYGQFRAIADNKTPEGRAENRRIEIVLIPVDIKDVLKDLR